ncbi:hypothetical protein [Domibacillus aminovorans]|uniref:Uncharacterized protein n=1 Tax=Domibacillus aminovorans TaxID=29332 RepID=A0A177L851_9BACI|nr:hypothetical protein [Domibacillus aminovorans]OAH61939.1 hypothetical protein AWH49_10980 [Domibacillus aminovorans]
MNKKSKYLLSVIGVSLTSLGIYGFYGGEEQNTTTKELPKQEVKVAEQEVKVAELESKLTVEATFPSYNLEELNQKADLIIEGKPTAVLDSYMVDENVPFTKFAFKVNKVYKGDIDKSKEIEFLQDGNSEMVFEDHPLLKVGKKYILFLRKSELGDLIMVGGPAGKFEYKESLKAYEDNSGVQLDENLTLK